MSEIDLDSYLDHSVQTNHDNIEKNHRKLAGECSQAIGALLTDLK